MIELTRVIISRRDSKPKKLLIPREDILQVEEHEDDRDIRIGCKVTYKVTEYQSGIMYVTDEFAKIAKQIAKEDKLNASIKTRR